MFVGSHVSIRNGYLGAAQLAHKQGARSFQYFAKNPRQLGIKNADRRDAEACRRYCQQHALRSVVHTAYPVNLAVDDEELISLTVATVINDMEIAEMCGSIGVVVHFGQYKGKETDPLYGYHCMIRVVNEILSMWDGQAQLLLENNAGQGSKMGTTLEELTQVRSLLSSPEKVGFCLDTCHAFASAIWNGANWEQVAHQARHLDYLRHVKVIHLNDSLYPHQSYRDRHANIGRGCIGVQGFQQLLATPEFAQLPLILETPRPVGAGHQSELEYVKKLLDAPV